MRKWEKRYFRVQISKSFLIHLKNLNVTGRFKDARQLLECSRQLLNMFEYFNVYVYSKMFVYFNMFVF